jgi:hypothetical protein
MSHPFDDDQLTNLAYQDPPDGWTICEPRTIEDQGRWWTGFSLVVTNGTDYYRIVWSQGSTEMQDEGPENIGVIRVYPHQVMTTVYKDTP